jgi:hypothetical protein
MAGQFKMCRKRVIGAVCIGGLTGIGILTFLYWTAAANIFQSFISEISSPLPGTTSADKYVGIATRKDLWLNGYLGLFFRFEYFGYLTWMMLPILVYFMFTLRGRPKWQLALLLSYACSAIIISYKGYFNSRYAFTLVPFTIVAIVALGWQLSDKRIYRSIFLILCAGFASLGFFQEGKTYRGYFEESFKNRYWRLIPDRMISYLNDPSNASDGAILVLDQPWFFYYTKRKGISHTDSRLAAAYGKKTPAEALDFIKDELGVGYILSSEKADVIYQDGLYRVLPDIERISTVPVFEDGGVALRRIAKIPDHMMNAASLEEFQQYSLLKNGSLEKWTSGGPVSPIYWQGASDIARDNNESRAGRFCARITGDGYNFYQRIYRTEYRELKTITCFAWIKTSVPNKYRIEIYDGFRSSLSETHNGDGQWHLLRAIHSIDRKSDCLDVRAVQASRTGNEDDSVLIDGILVFAGEYFNLTFPRMNERSIPANIDPADTSVFTAMRDANMVENGSFDVWPNGPNANPDSWQGASMIQRVRSGVGGPSRYAAKIAGDGYNFFQRLHNAETVRQKTITCFAWIKTSVPDKFRMEIYDGRKSTTSATHNGDGQWHLLRAIHVLDPGAEVIDVRAVQAARTGRTNDIVFISGVLVVEGEHFELNSVLSNRLQPVSQSPSERWN